MIALLARLTDWLWGLNFLEVVGLFTVLCGLSLTALFGVAWAVMVSEARRSERLRREENARDEAAAARWMAMEEERLREARTAANKAMLERLTAEDHAEIRRIIHDSQTEAA